MRNIIINSIIEIMFNIINLIFVKKIDNYIYKIMFYIKFIIDFEKYFILQFYRLYSYVNVYIYI